MAIIVDKVQKRRDIALSCTELLLEKGIKKLTVSEVAKTAGVSKGSIYDYFENKEDIVFEIIRTDIEAYQVELNNKLNNSLSTREKVFLLFSFLLDDNEDFKKQQKIYKEYISIDLSCENNNMTSFNGECGNFFKSILNDFIQKGIDKGELKKESINLVDGLLALEKGFLIINWTENKEIKDDLKLFLNTLFDLIEIKKDC